MRALGRAQRVDAVGDDLERVDIQAGVGLIEQRQRRLEHQHLQNLVALFLAAGKALVDAAAEEALIDVHELHLGAHQGEEVERVDIRLRRARGARR